MDINRVRVQGREFCEVHVILEKGNFRVSHSQGDVLTRKRGRAEALDYWTSFFEQSPSDVLSMGERFGKVFRTPAAAAKFVLDTDGDCYGLDVVRETKELVLVSRTGGSVGPGHPELKRFWPEIEKHLSWNLNDMHPGCEHQESLGWGNGFTVAVTNSSWTPAQQKYYEMREERRVNKAASKLVSEWRALRSHAPAQEAKKLMVGKGSGTLSLHDLECFYGVMRSAGHTDALLQVARKHVLDAGTVEKFLGEVYVDSLGAPCPECGYAYGTAWLKREIPREVLREIRELSKLKSDPPWDQFDKEKAK